MLRAPPAVCFSGQRELKHIVVILAEDTFFVRASDFFVTFFRVSI